MSQFEYLSVLTSIIIGLAMTNLLSGAARLIQRRHRIRPHFTTLCWMAILFLINIQVWWVAFERRNGSEWGFFSFLLYLLIPIIVFLLSYLVLPDLGDEDAVDLQANFNSNRGWFFGLAACLPAVSLLDEAFRDGRVPLDLDAGFRVLFLAISLSAARIGSARFHFWNAIAVLVLLCAYIAVLFARLR